MESKSNDNLIKNNLFKKINFEKHSNKCFYNISKSLMVCFNSKNVYLIIFTYEYNSLFILFFLWVKMK